MFQSFQSALPCKEGHEEADNDQKPYLVNIRLLQVPFCAEIKAQGTSLSGPPAGLCHKLSCCLSRPDFSALAELNANLSVSLLICDLAHWNQCRQLGQNQ